MVFLCEDDISASLSFHHLIEVDHPRGVLHVWLQGCWVEKTLFWLAIQISHRGFFMGLALSGGLLHPCHDSSKWQPLKLRRASCVPICTAVYRSVGSVVVMSHTEGSHSTSCCGGLHNDHHYLHRDKLSTSSTFILPDSCQHHPIASAGYIYSRGMMLTTGAYFHLHLKDEWNRAAVS